MEETISVLGSKGSRLAAEMLWQQSESDQALQHRLAVMVLRARLKSVPSLEEIQELLGNLKKLCEFQAEWRDSETGWALFLTEVVDTIEAVLVHTSMDAIEALIREIAVSAEESSSHIDDCYSCGLEIERIEHILENKK
jgi:hypothetical protein